MESDNESIIDFGKVHVSCDIDGKKVYHEDLLVAYLLVEDVLFVGSSGRICVLINDTFVHAADAEEIDCSESGDEIIDIYERYKANDWLGVIAWVMEKRKLQPLKRYVDQLKEKGLWKEEYDTYEKNNF